jgi:inosine-uridine nucleoside N-ribohydrolase
MEGAGTLTRAIVAVLLLLLPPGVTAQPASGKVKVIADQDSAGPQGTNFLSLLMLLNAPQVDLLGITTVSGDQWMEPATVFALHAVELAGRTDVPVVKGAEQPLVNSRREQELREQLYGSHPTWHGSFNPDAPPPDRTWPPPGGFPKTKPRPGRAADFIIDTIRANPRQVVLYCAGPLTNIALAVRMDPGIVPLTKALYVMGASNKGGFELNWWWDPEAAAIVMREPWKEIVVTPAETGFQPYTSPALMQRIVKAGGRFARHVQEVYLDTPPQPGVSHWSAMWDEVLAAAIVDPAVIKKSETLYLDVDITHGPKYGHTVVWTPPAGVPSFFEAYSGPDPPDPEKWKGHLAPPAHLRPATVHMEVDIPRFEQVFVDLMSRP